MIILMNCPFKTPTSRVKSPVKKSTADSVDFRPARSDTHPINSGMGRVKILDMVIKELAWALVMPWISTRNSGSMEYTPRVPITPRLNRTTMIQKERCPTRGKNAVNVGDSPKKSFTWENLKK